MAEGEDGGLATGAGVSDEPCPEAVHDDTGCIYLGSLTDLTGPFQIVGVQASAGGAAFWARVNEAGGVPGTFWSGWAFEDVDHGLVLEAGYSYCLESMIGLDWSHEHEGEVGSVQAVGFPGDYGGDVAAGAAAWAAANGADDLGFVETAPNSAIGSQDAAVQQVVTAGADRVVLGVSPVEAAEIVGGAVAAGFEGRFLASVPVWNPALVDSPVADALADRLVHLSPVAGFDGVSDAHEAMRAQLDGEVPANDYFTIGWMASYPLRALLEAAVEAGDLTRAGVRAAVDGLTVDFEGALPTVTYSGDADATVVRTGTIARPDAGAPLGLTVVADQVSGPTAEGYANTSPCVGSGL